MCRCKTRSFFPFCHSFFSCFVLSCRYRSITFFFSLSFALLFSFSSRRIFFQIRHTLMTGRAEHYTVTPSTYACMHGLVPFLFSVCLLLFLYCFAFSCTMTNGRAFAREVAGGRRFFSSLLFSQTKFTSGQRFFFSLCHSFSFNDDE